MRNRIYDHRGFAHDARLSDGNRARDPGGNCGRNDLRQCRRFEEDERLVCAAGEFELAAVATIAAHHVAVVALLVWLDVTIAAHIRHGGVDTKSKRPGLEIAGEGRGIIGNTQRPIAIGGLIAKPGGIGNGEFGPEHTGIWRCSCRNRGCRGIAELRAEEVCRGTHVCGEITFHAVRPNEPSVDVPIIRMRDVERRNDSANDARLRDVDQARNAAVGSIRNCGRGAVVNDDRDFAGIACDVGQTDTRASVAVCRIAVVAEFATRNVAIAAGKCADIGHTRARVALFDETCIGASVAGDRIHVVAFFRASHCAITAAQHCANAGCTRAKITRIDNAAGTTIIGDGIAVIASFTSFGETIATNRQWTDAESQAP